MRRQPNPERKGAMEQIPDYVRDRILPEGGRLVTTIIEVAFITVAVAGLFLFCR